MSWFGSTGLGECRCGAGSAGMTMVHLPRSSALGSSSYEAGEGFVTPALPTRIRAKDLCHRPCRRRYGRRICVAVFSNGDTGEEFASSALPMAIRAKDLQLACLSSVVPLSVCLFLSVFLLIAVYSHRSSIVASLPPRSKAPAQPSRAPWLSPRHLGETETTIETAIDRHEERKIEGAFVLFMFIYKKDTPN